MSARVAGRTVIWLMAGGSWLVADGRRGNHVSVLRKNFGIRAANVVSLQLIGGRGLSGLDLFPSEARDDIATRIWNVLDRQACFPGRIGEERIRRNELCTLVLGEKFLAAQETLPNNSGLRSDFVFANVEFSPAGIDSAYQTTGESPGACHGYKA